MTAFKTSLAVLCAASVMTVSGSIASAATKAPAKKEEAKKESLGKPTPAKSKQGYSLTVYDARGEKKKK
jgi:hypothetical protein